MNLHSHGTKRGLGLKQHLEVPINSKQYYWYSFLEKKHQHVLCFVNVAAFNSHYSFDMGAF